MSSEKIDGRVVLIEGPSRPSKGGKRKRQLNAMYKKLHIKKKPNSEKGIDKVWHIFKQEPSLILEQILLKGGKAGLSPVERKILIRICR